MLILYPLFVNRFSPNMQSALTTASADIESILFQFCERIDSIYIININKY